VKSALQDRLNWPSPDANVDETLDLRVLDGGDEKLGSLRIQMRVDADRKWHLGLTLHLEGAQFQSQGGWSVFEDEFHDLQHQLPDHVLLKCCWGCAFSDYSPAGSDVFGSLACFRGNKRGYLGVRDKEQLFAIWDTRTEMVEETYLCDEFAPRVPGTGYRG
jgi:hypothetical protein